ncbi:MAG: NosD domain-containing protein [Candidatus Woesearchaeota archaeon]
MKKITHLLVLIAFLPCVFSTCEDAFDLMQITKDTILCNKAYDVPSGITIKTDNITLDCNGAIIRGTALQDGQGITVDHANGVTVKNCNILNYDVGIYVKEGNRNTIKNNALLKNRIGVRMYQAFENRFENNADKSILKPVSSLASKFNTFWITNKELDRDFCKENICNGAGIMNPCENEDFYCSPSCSYQNDNDCPAPTEQSKEEPEQETPAPAEPKKPESTPQTLNLSTQKQTSTPIMSTGTVTKSFMQMLPEKARFWTMTFLAVIAYLFGFLCFQHHHYKHG